MTTHRQTNQPADREHDAPVCPYCGQTTELRTGADIYPRYPDLSRRLFYACVPCEAWVGCHDDGRPLGTPANAALRAERRRTHHVFDRLWQGEFMTRSQAYSLLAEWIGDSEHAHIGESSAETCQMIRAKAAQQLNHLIQAGRRPSNTNRPPR